MATYVIGAGAVILVLMFAALIGDRLGRRSGKRLAAAIARRDERVRDVTVVYLLDKVDRALAAAEAADGED